MNSIKNSVRLVGHLGMDPDVRTFDNNTKKARLSLATNENYKNNKGEKVTETQWHNLVLWGAQAQIAGDMLKKGDEIVVEGRLTNSNYTDKEGNKRYVCEVVVNEFLKLGSKSQRDFQPNAINLIQPFIIIFVMYLEAKETARLYTLLSDKLGSDTTEAMFKYIDNKTEREVENSIQSLVTKDDLADVRYGLSKEISEVRVAIGKEIGDIRVALGREIVNIQATAAENKSEMTRWMFIFWLGQVGATVASVALFLKK